MNISCTGYTKILYIRYVKFVLYGRIVFVLCKVSHGLYYLINLCLHSGFKIEFYMYITREGFINQRQSELQSS